jgi:hypothetical protein
LAWFTVDCGTNGNQKLSPDNPVAQLRSKRIATVDRIAIAIGRGGARPTGLESLAACTLANAGPGAGGKPGAVLPRAPDRGHRGQQDGGERRAPWPP